MCVRETETCIYMYYVLVLQAEYAEVVRRCGGEATAQVPGEESVCERVCVREGGRGLVSGRVRERRVRKHTQANMYIHIHTHTYSFTEMKFLRDLDIFSPSMYR